MAHSKKVNFSRKSVLAILAILLIAGAGAFFIGNRTSAQDENKSCPLCPQANSDAVNLVPTEVYSNNFETTVGNEWRNVQTNQIPATSVTPVGARKFLGEFGNNEIRLTLNNLPAHNRVSVVFDLYVIRTWGGNTTSSGPDIFEFGYDGETSIRTTFSNVNFPGVDRQAYPDNFPGGNYPLHTGASEVNTLGYIFAPDGLNYDSVYQISRAFQHTSNSLQLKFYSNLDESLSNESWGIDNVRVLVETIPNETVTTLMPYESPGYRYQILPPTQTVPAGFEQPNYNDSAWSVGQASFGYNDGCVFPFNLKTHWQTNTRLILRKNVYVPPGATNLGVKLSVDNDIEKIWFNGTQIAGFQENSNCPLRDEYGYSIPQNLVQTGNNLIAYQVLDRGRQTFFDSRIVADYALFCSTPTNGLVSWWKAEDGFFQDFNTNTNGMTLAVGNWSLVNGQLQNGPNGFATINVASQTNPKLTALVTAQSLISEGPQLFFKDATVNEIYVDYYANGGTLRIVKNGSVLASTPASLPLNAQREMSFEVNGSTVTGKLGTTTVSATTTLVQPFTVFAIGGYSNGESGLWDDLRLSGNLALDSAGTNNGTLQNGTTFTTGKVGQAFSLDDQDDYVDIGQLSQLQNATELTVMAWVKKRQLGRREGFVGKWNTSEQTNNSFLFLNGGAGNPNDVGVFALRSTNGNQFVIAGTNVIPANEWVHIVGTWRSSDGQLRIYKNGVIDGETTGGVGQTLNYITDYTAKIGNWGVIRSDDYKFYGDIDEIKIYNRALSATEVYNTYAAGNSQTCQLNSTSKPFDFDGDGKSDVSVFRPSNTVWYASKSSDSQVLTAQWGIASDKIVPADYNGDGKTDYAVFRDGFWYILYNGGGFQGAQWGAAGDIPFPADFDGDGKADLAVFRNGIWFVLKSSGGTIAQNWGSAGDIPVIADYDNDNKADFAVYRNGVWYILFSTGGNTAIQWGIAGDKTVTGDYNGDGKADYAVFRNGFWYILLNGGGFIGAQWGTTGDLPAPADYDGDGKTDLAVFRSGVWYIQRTTAGVQVVNFGSAGDKPVANAFVP